MNATVVIGIIFGFVCVIFFIFLLSIIGPYIRAQFSQAPVRIFDLFGMKLRKVPPRLMVEARIRREPSCWMLWPRMGSGSSSRHG